MPFLNQYEYLIFLTDSFNLYESLTLSNIGFIISLFLLISYLFFVVFFICKNKPETIDSDKKMNKILSDYKREVQELHHQNLNSFYSLATEPNFHQLRNVESFLIQQENKPETEIKTLSATEEKDRPEFKEIVMNNSVDLQIETPNLNSIQVNEVEMGKHMELNSIKNEIKKENVIAPPTFSDRFEVAPNIKTNDKSMNLDISGISTFSGIGPVPSRLKNNGKDASVKSKRKRKHNVISKFKQILIISNPLFSLQKESKLFPRHLRITLIYCEIILSLFLTSVNVVYLVNQKKLGIDNLIINAGISCLVSWGVFLALTMIATTDKEKLMASKNDDDFYSALIIYEKEFKIKVNFFLININIFFIPISFLKLVLLILFLILIDIFYFKIKK